MGTHNTGDETMKVIENTLKVELELWEDPGVYPSNAGGAALKSFEYIDGSGHMIVEFEGEEGMADLEDCIDELVESEVDIPRNASMRYDLIELPYGRVKVQPEWDSCTVD
jgi:hypothetical protein